MFRKPSDDVLTLGLYQLENLWAQKVPYLLIDISEVESNTQYPPQIRQATRLKPTEVKSYLLQTVTDSNLPIIFICADGKSSLRMALEMMRATKLTNFFVFEGGLSSLTELKTH